MFLKPLLDDMREDHIIMDRSIGCYNKDHNRLLGLRLISVNICIMSTLLRNNRNARFSLA